MPEVRNKDWPLGAIDHFIAAGHEAQCLEPSPEADRRTLIRRLSFDLAGLPPTAAEVQAFEKDKSPQDAVWALGFGGCGDGLPAELLGPDHPGMLYPVLE